MLTESIQQRLVGCQRCSELGCRVGELEGQHCTLNTFVTLMQPTEDLNKGKCLLAGGLAGHPV